LVHVTQHSQIHAAVMDLVVVVAVVVVAVEHKTATDAILAQVERTLT